MAKIAVFDSGFGSLSIIKPIQQAVKSDIVYFADQKNFPYGKKSKLELTKIITKTVNMLEEKFKPDLIVIGSNTPSILVEINKKNITPHSEGMQAVMWHLIVSHPKIKAHKTKW